MRTALASVAALLWVVWVFALLVFRRRPELRVGTPREFVYPVAALHGAQSARATAFVRWLASPPPQPASQAIDSANPAIRR